MVLDTYGEDQGEGYDIACQTDGLVARSKLTGPKAKELRLKFFVDAFHGYAHERACMVNYHPLYRFKDGVGLEDFDGCERFFAWVNRCASLLRHATSYRWMQFIELTVKQWDSDRYASLGKYLIMCSLRFRSYLSRRLLTRQLQAGPRDHQRR